MNSHVTTTVGNSNKHSGTPVNYYGISNPKTGFKYAVNAGGIIAAEILISDKVDYTPGVTVKANDDVIAGNLAI